MSSLIIGITGERYAGKDTIAEYLVKTRQADHIKYSHILDEILEVLDLPITRRNEIDLGLSLRQAFGPDILWTAMLKRIKKSWSGMVVINGIRFKDEFDRVKELEGKIIYITAPQNLLFERSKIRTEKADDGELNLDAFKKQENELTESGIPDLGAKADFKIENTGSMEDLYKKVDEIISKFSTKY